MSTNSVYQLTQSSAFFLLDTFVIVWTTAEIGPMNASQIAKCLSIVTMIRHAFQRKACVMKTMIASKIEKQFNYELFGNLLVKLKCSKTAFVVFKTE